MTILNGYDNENARMRLLREEEDALGLWTEYPTNELTAHRLLPLAPPAPASAVGTQPAPTPAARHDDHDAGRVGLLEGSLLARVLWEERGVET